jgi:hypothetical protein
MGPLFILAFWAIIATIGSVVGGLVLAGLAALLTRGVTNGRKRAITIAGLLPAAGFVYLFCFVMLFSVWSTARGRDMGWGDGWNTPILGNYYLEMIDVTDHATIYNHADKKVSGDDGVHYGPADRDVIDGVRRLEVCAPYLVGSAGPDDFGHEGNPSPEDRFFIMDTRSNTRTDYASLAELEHAARALNLPFALRTVDAVYEDARYDWLDLIPLTIFAVPALGVGIVLVYALLRLRAKRSRAISA